MNKPDHKCDFCPKPAVIRIKLCSSHGVIMARMLMKERDHGKT